MRMMRFTGSEIHRDVVRCVDQVYDYLMKQHSRGVDLAYAFERVRPIPTRAKLITKQ